MNVKINKEYRRAVNGNRQVMQSFICEIDQEIMSRGDKDTVSEGGGAIKMRAQENRLVFRLRKELSGRYYKIMYPFAKKEVDHAD